MTSWSLRRGADDAPEVLVQQLTVRSYERDRLKREIARLAARQTIAAEEVKELIDYVGGLASALRDATDEEKGELYKELGLDLTCDPWNISSERSWCQG